MRESGLGAAYCVPAIPSLLQLALPGMEGPADPAERVEALCASMGRLARFEPACVICLTGPVGDRSEAEARALVIEGLQQVAAAARAAGVRLGLEPTHSLGVGARRPSCRRSARRSRCSTRPDSTTSA